MVTEHTGAHTSIRLLTYAHTKKNMCAYVYLLTLCFPAKLRLNRLFVSLNLFRINIQCIYHNFRRINRSSNNNIETSFKIYLYLKSYMYRVQISYISLNKTILG